MQNTNEYDIYLINDYCQSLLILVFNPDLALLHAFLKSTSEHLKH